MTGQLDQAEPEPEPAVAARGIEMRGPWGPVYGPIDLDIDAGGVTVLVCPAGSGRTALLLTLAGRMLPVKGELTVFGRRGRDVCDWRSSISASFVEASVFVSTSIHVGSSN